MRQRKRKFSFFWLTVSLVLSSNCPAFHQEMVAGGLEPTAWHATSYSLPALNDKFSPTRRTSNIFTTKKKKWEKSYDRKNKIKLSWKKREIENKYRTVFVFFLPPSSPLPPDNHNNVDDDDDDNDFFFYFEIQNVIIFLNATNDDRH